MADFLGKGDGGGLGDCKEQQPLWDRRPLHRYGRETRFVECGGDLWRRNVILVQLESCWIIAVKMYNKWTKVAAYFSLNNPPQKDQKDL